MWWCEGVVVRTFDFLKQMLLLHFGYGNPGPDTGLASKA
jgi:hypothetical protein